MARIPDAFIDDLLARTDIVELIGARVPLKRQGREYSARCPFHDERSPSFTVSPTKQFYHCFGCGAHGTAISFLMNYDRLEFLDAVDELAKRVGTEVPRDTQQRNANPDSVDMYAALEAADQFFRRQLAASPKASNYFEQRGVSDAVRAQFGLGYAPDGFSALRDALGTDPRRMKLLERVGLFSKNDKGHVYDKFRDRVMFPIHDRRGRTIAFGGRVLQKDDGPKYLNSPETPLFHKGRELYGLWQVRQANQKIARLIVVEGYMDVIALFQHGIAQAVATLGTATTPDHAELLFRNAPDVYFCFDGDRAGRSAAWKAVEACVGSMKDGRRAFFLFLPEGEDPDSILQKKGKDSFETVLENSVPLSNFIFREIERDVNTRTIDGKSKVWEICKPLVGSMPDGSFRDRMIEELHQRVGNPNKLDRTYLGTGEELRANPRGLDPQQIGNLKKLPAQIHKRSLIRSVITLLLQCPTLALSTPPPYPFDGLQQPGVPLLAELMDLVHARPDITTGALLEHFAEREEGAALQKLAMLQMPGEDATWQTEFHDALAQLEKQTLQQRVDVLMLKWREAGTPSALTAQEHEELKVLQQAIKR